MNVLDRTNSEVRLRLDDHESARLLQGLEENADALGPTGSALARALRAAGVTPPDPPNHLRGEYAPPLPD